MPNIVGRIEREYLLTILSDSLPSLSVVSCGQTLAITGKSYAVRENLLFFSTKKCSVVSKLGTSIKVCFSHGQSILSFTASRMNPPGTEDEYQYCILDEMYRVEADPDSRTGVFIVSGDTVHSFFEDGEYPLGCIDYAPAEMNAQQEVLGILCRRAGLPDTGISPLSVRLYQFLDDLKQGRRSSVDPFLLYIDHQYMIVTGGRHESFSSGATFAARYACNKPGQRRQVVFNPSVTSTMPVNRMTQLLFFSLNDIEQEDKRFLYEFVHHDLYNG